MKKFKESDLSRPHETSKMKVDFQKIQEHGPVGISKAAYKTRITSSKLHQNSIETPERVLPQNHKRISKKEACFQIVHDFSSLKKSKEEYRTK